MYDKVIAPVVFSLYFSMTSVDNNVIIFENKHLGGEIVDRNQLYGPINPILMRNALSYRS
uniref:Uncharacterized protein n=1 Tax=Schistosoma mansoni TaxID=6183 RepID=A0A5K4F7D9_SCHMA